MEKLELHGIKPDSVKSILIDIASRNKTARASIAKDTGLSVMTVGKVADILLDAGLLDEVKLKGETSGRRAGILSLRSERYAVVLDLSERVFRLNIIDMKMTLVHSMRYTYNRKLYYDENLLSFLKNVRAVLDRVADPNEMYGIGIIVPGIYVGADDRIVSTKIPELETIKVRETAERILGRRVTLIKRNVEAAARSYAAANKSDDSDVIVYMYMGECVDGAVYSHGRFEEGAHEFGCDFGRMISGGVTLEERVRMCGSDYDVADGISDAVYNLIMIFDPDVFIIENDLLREPEMFVKRLEDRIENVYKLPEERMPYFPVDHHELRHSARGIAIEMRSMWVDEILYKQ